MTQEEYLEQLFGPEGSVGNAVDQTFVAADNSSFEVSNINESVEPSSANDMYLDQLFGDGTASELQTISVGTQQVNALEQVESGWLNNLWGSWNKGIRGGDIATTTFMGMASMDFETLKGWKDATKAWRDGRLRNRDGKLLSEDEMDAFYEESEGLSKDSGLHWQTIEEQIGSTPEEWDAMSHPERMLKLRKNADERAESYDYDEDAWESQLGQFLGVMTTPTLAITMSSKVAIGAYGAVDASLYQYGQQGKVSPITPVLGFVAAPLAIAGVQLATKGVSKGVEKLNKINEEKAMLKEVGAEVDRLSINSPTRETDLIDYSLVPKALENLGISSKVFDDLTIKRGPIKRDGNNVKFNKARKQFNHIMEPISEGIKRINPAIYGKMIGFQQKNMRNSQFVTSLVTPFLSKAFPMINKKILGGGYLNKEQQLALQLKMANASKKTDVDDIISFLKKSGPKGNVLAKDFVEYRKGMDLMYDLRSVVKKKGQKKLGKITGYSPRKVIDNIKWYKTGGEEVGPINKILSEKYGIKDPKLASDDIIKAAINDWLRSTSKNISKAGSGQSRVIKNVKPEQLDAYAKPWQATNNYIRESFQEIEQHQMFGSSVAKNGDLDLTVSDYIAKNIKKLPDANDQVALKELLTAKYINGPQQMSKWVQKVKDLGYISLLGHPTNAVRQIADVASSIYENGLVNAMKGVMATLNRNKMLSPKEMGLIDNVAQDFTSVLGTKRFIDKTFGVTGFRAVDALGKGTLINSTLYKSAKSVKSVKGSKDFMDEYTPFFGVKDTLQAVKDFKAFNKGTLKEPTEMMRNVAFIKLSKFQPIDLMEMPKAYLNMKNGRMMYMLQSFGIKHFNVIRQDVFKELARGNITKGIKNLGYLATVYTTLNMGADKVIDLMLGRDTKLENSFWTNIYRSTGIINKYDMDQLARDGNIYDWVIDTVSPPLDPTMKGMTNIFEIGRNLAVGNNWNANMPKPLEDLNSALPFGKQINAWLYNYK